MDCRKTLGLGLCLLLGTAGCMHQGAPTPPQASNTSAPTVVQSVPPNAVVKKAADLPMRQPQARTCVAAADYLALEGTAPELTEPVREMKRDEVRRSYQQALTIDPHNMQAYLGLASLYVAMKDHDHAMATYQKACQMLPNEARVFYEMGRCYGGLKDFDHAIPAPGSARSSWSRKNRSLWTRWAGCRRGPAATTTACEPSGRSMTRESRTTSWP